ncbi:hypothetical protein C8R42DRAFT_640705 [Lentinula raphanica]|nr:hypothetical protein C8R42DRAFT_640705 [Lentinula raphanica]
MDLYLLPLILYPQHHLLGHLPPNYPSYEPDNFVSLDEVCDAATFNIPPSAPRDPESGFGARKCTTDVHTRFPSSTSDSLNPYTPFPDASTYRMMKFAYSESNDNSFGLAGIQRVNDEIIQQPGFDPGELRTFNAQTEAKKLDKYIASQTLQSDLPFDNHAGRKRSSVRIPLPCIGHKNVEGQAPMVVIDDIIHRDLLEVMKEAYSPDASSEYHLRGYKQMWQRDDRPDPIRIHGEMENEVLSNPPEPGCDLEQVVAPIMVHSDSTHLASFGTVSICLGYVWFGSQSEVQVFACKTKQVCGTSPCIFPFIAARARRKTNNQQNTDTPRKLFNLNTYKFHALGDYPWTIRTFGTTDSYSTQLSELEHRRVKRLLLGMNNVVAHSIIFYVENVPPRVIKDTPRDPKLHNLQLTSADSDPLPFTDPLSRYPLSRYHVSSNNRISDNLTTWLGGLQDEYFIVSSS